MTPLLLAAALAAAPSVTDQRFLIVAHDVVGDTIFSYSLVYDTASDARLAAEKIALCGFWRVNPDPNNPEISLVPPGAVRQIFLRGVDGTPPASPAMEAGLPPELPPPPTVDGIVDCPASGRARRWVKQSY